MYMFTANSFLFLLFLLFLLFFLRVICKEYYTFAQSKHTLREVPLSADIVALMSEQGDADCGFIPLKFESTPIWMIYSNM